MLWDLLQTVPVNRRFFLRSPLAGIALSVAPKPAPAKLAREVELVRTFVAGTAYYEAEPAHPMLGLGEDLILRRQPENPYDGKAIEVFTRSGMKLGYVPRLDNSALSALMDDGRRLAARVTSLRPDHFRDIGMAIALVE
ncbi:MAG TPA: HIRAN domain-containing protein [Alphaproteobacteria bacterium]|nr:HIRAN domain-containing protein [Alphaproteobacteria bacterium]